MAAFDISKVGRTNKMLSYGKTSKVYLGLNSETKEKYAVKIIDKKTVDPRFISLIKEEIRLIMTLDHPHIVKTYHVTETKYLIKIVMELFSGDLLKFHQTYGKLVERDAYIIFRQIVSAINYLHNERHIVHRDIKLANILFNNDDDMTVVLADFGFATHREPDGPLFTKVMGTPRYLAPEIKSKVPHPGYPADIYALGICLYTLVTGHYPEDPIKIDKSINPNLIDLLKQMLIDDPDQRIKIEEIIKHPWMIELNNIVN